MSATRRSYTQNFFKVQYIIIQAIRGRKSMKKIIVTDEKIFRVYKATITQCDLSPRFFCIDATSLCEFESDKIQVNEFE